MQFYQPNRKVSYGLDLSKVFIGQKIISSHNITVDESVHSVWNGFIPTSSYTENSKEFAGRLGFHQLYLPYGFMMNLTLSISVESYTYSGIRHIETRDAVYISPAFPGDTFSCTIIITGISHTPDGQTTILQAFHQLSNQKGEAVFSLTRVTAFPRLEPRTTIPPTDLQPTHNHLFKEKILSRVRGITLYNAIDNYTQGDLVLHPYVRPIGKSENLFWSTYLKNSHPIHYNYQRYQPGEIIVSGGIVEAMVLGIAGYEFRQILLSQIKTAFHTSPVMAEDRIGAFSFVGSVNRVMPGFEEITVITYGLKNVDTEQELSESDFPECLFDEAVNNHTQIDAIDAIIERYCPVLAGRVCCRIEWTLLRKNE